MMKHLVTPAFLILLVAVKNNLAIHCYECNSFHEPACDDPIKDNVRLSVVNCGFDEMLGLNATICRKLIQTSLCQKKLDKI